MQHTMLKSLRQVYHTSQTPQVTWSISSPLKQKILSLEINMIWQELDDEKQMLISQLEELIRSFNQRLHLLEKHLVEKKPATRGVSGVVARPLQGSED